MDDLNDLVRYANNSNIAKFMMNQFPHPYTAERGKEFISFAMNDLPLHIFAIDIDGKASGGIGIYPLADIQCKNAELGYWLAEPFWNKGIITQAIIRMTEYGFHHFDIERIFARPFGSNLASQRALEKAGFVPEGRFEKTFYKNGVYEDELIYAVRKRASTGSATSG